MGTVPMFADSERKCRECGVIFLPFSLDLFKMVVRIDEPFATPQEQHQMAKNGYRLQSMCCCFEHLCSFRAREQERIEHDAWERYFSKIR